MSQVETLPGARKMKILAVIALALAAAGCAQQQATRFETRTVEIVSAKPYRFITYSIEDTAETRRQVRAHNRAHQAVLDAEKAKN